MTTKIDWVKNSDGTQGKTWNPVTGCTKISPGCVNCYAEVMAKRLQAMGTKGYEDGFKVTVHPERLPQPLSWKKSSMIFVCSMGDLFHDDVPFEFIAAVFGVMAAASRHTFQVLTKRPARLLEFFESEDWFKIGRLLDAVSSYKEGLPVLALCTVKPQWPLPNVWLGVTAEDQRRADERIPLLQRVPAAKRFVSCEPLLGPIDFYSEALGDPLCRCEGCLSMAAKHPGDGGLQRIDWIIAGCEKVGHGLGRPAKIEWFRSIRDQCEGIVPFFLKQAAIYGKLEKMPELDGCAWDQMPEVTS